MFASVFKHLDENRIVNGGIKEKYKNNNKSKWEEKPKIAICPHMTN